MLGIASWYGPGFDGHRTSSGAIYNQDAMTAASTLFPLGTELQVTNLDNGRAVEVVVNDHGPYLKDRGLDLSHRAAQTLGMLGPGTAHVRMDVLKTPAGGPALGQRYFVQLGSFADPVNARLIGSRLAADYRDVTVTEAIADERRVYRVRMGAFFDREQAEQRAAGMARLGYHSLIISE
jgi:rare lipoprotein A